MRVPGMEVGFVEYRKSLLAWEVTDDEIRYVGVLFLSVPRCQSRGEGGKSACKLSTSPLPGFPSSSNSNRRLENKFNREGRRRNVLASFRLDYFPLPLPSLKYTFQFVQKILLFSLDSFLHCFVNYA